MEYLRNGRQWYGLKKVMTTALTYCTNIGISRWEYYVGMNENRS